MTFEQKITKILENWGSCEFCGDVLADLRTDFEAHDGSQLSCIYCTNCFFGTNPHISSFPLIISDNVEEDEKKCMDCEEKGDKKITFVQTGNVLHLCLNHLCSDTPSVMEK
tara:strand:- start:55 stop:387 length:333 start_codon:yes stop_codon:yes gene_type:complete